ncbi:MAG: hypothetical protein JW969_09610 [Spirochaetales bacterium]|nr:hypothetical protein [Spirochaetales bacterium]
MSCDFFIFNPSKLDGNKLPEQFDSNIPLDENSMLYDFYVELTGMHPEINDVPESKLDDTDYCPWSAEIGKDADCLSISCVWSKAEYVHDLLLNLVKKHKVTMFDPQTGDMIT